MSNKEPNTYGWNRLYILFYLKCGFYAAIVKVNESRIYHLLKKIVKMNARTTNAFFVMDPVHFFLHKFIDNNFQNTLDNIQINSSKNLGLTICFF